MVILDAKPRLGLAKVDPRERIPGSKRVPVSADLILPPELSSLESDFP